jgi:hypothetical protein
VNEGFRLDETVVLVFAAAATVIVSVHPPLTVPAGSPVPIFIAYRLQLPFGFPPLKIDANVAVPFGAAQFALAGAGLRKLVHNPVLRLVGLNVPETSCALESAFAAESSKVRFKFENP